MSSRSFSRRNNFRTKSGVIKKTANVNLGSLNHNGTSITKRVEVPSTQDGPPPVMSNRNGPNSRPNFRRLFSTGSMTTPKGPNKRRVTISGWQDIKCWPKRRRANSVARPTKFLLGGNINDPLNLKSLEDEEVNRKLNALTPASSPVPVSRHRTQVQIFIPQNIYDPLNLNTGEDIELSIITPRSRKRKRHRRSRKEDVSQSDTKNETLCQIDSSANDQVSASLFTEENGKETELADPDPVASTITSDITIPESTSCLNKVESEPEEKNSQPEKISPSEKVKSIHCEKIKISSSEKSSDEKFVLDKIVSPVVPQGTKFYKRQHLQASVKKDRKWHSKKQNFPKDLEFSPKNSRFGQGSNPLRYHCDKAQDVRFKFFSKFLFAGKDVLDIGCNVGCVSAHIAESYEPKTVVGIDIDSKAINIAQQHVLKHVNSSIVQKEKFPISLQQSLGPLFRLQLAMGRLDSTKFPHNLSFVQGNYVLSSDEELQMQEPEYDVILCLRATKWIHLNWGDEGLKRAFKRMFSQLRCGGQLVLEPQPWIAYSKTRKLTETIFNNYNSIELKPEKFVEYLLSKEVGFVSCKVLGRISNHKRGYGQSLYILTKMVSFSPAHDIQDEVVSPIVFNDIEWARSCEDEQDSACEWDNVVSGNDSPTDFPSPPDLESSHYDLGAENMFLDDGYFFPSDYGSIQDLYEQ